MIFPECPQEAKILEQVRKFIISLSYYNYEGKRRSKKRTFQERNEIRLTLQMFINILSFDCNIYKLFHSDECLNSFMERYLVTFDDIALVYDNII
jgi:hypothetical protein